MSRQPRFEVCQSDAGWFARFRAANGRKLWQTEVYSRERAALHAIGVMWSAFGMEPQHAAIHEVDERTEAKS